MNYLDLILGIPLVWALYKGFKRGLILELAMLVGLIVGLYAGLHFSNLASAYLQDSFHLEGSWLPLLSFALVFLLVLLGVYLLGKVLEKAAEALMLGFFNKLGGALFAGVKMALILSFLLFLLESFAPGGRLFNKEKTRQSILYGPIASFAPLLMPRVKEVIHEKKHLEILAAEGNPTLIGFAGK